MAQQVFFDAWCGIGKLRAATSFLPWLRALARNHARMAVRRASRFRARVVAMDATHDVIGATADPSPDALITLLDEEARAALAAALDAVPDAAREVLVLYYREGQSVRQVAELLGMREATVKQRLSRARRVLRAEYLARVGELLDHSAPGAAFTAMVTAGLATAALAASPGVAAAAVLSKGVAAGGSGSLTGARATGHQCHGLCGWRRQRPAGPLCGCPRALARGGQCGRTGGGAPLCAECAQCHDRLYCHAGERSDANRRRATDRGDTRRDRHAGHIHVAPPERIAAGARIAARTGARARPHRHRGA
ncbi:MAG: sigma-70 family RNA polymerase sigma factor [Gemmatimonas sp.]|nr:sigma-70 family RNA polymerase sigma factor [Gemmatimonas sp.]